MDNAHTLPIRVYYEDTDMGGIVYYANYLKFIERARSEIVRDLGLDQNAMKAAGIVFAISRVEADYLAPARLDDLLEVRTTHHAASPVRWMFDQQVWREDTCLFRAVVTAICMTTAGKPTRLPQSLRG